MIKVLYNFLRASERGFIEPPRDPAIYENVHILTVFLFFFSFVIVVMLKFLGGNIYTFKKAEETEQKTRTRNCAFVGEKKLCR